MSGNVWQVEYWFSQITSELDLPINYVPITGPAADALDQRNEISANPRITATELRDSYSNVKEELFTDFTQFAQAALLRHGRGAGLSSFNVSEGAITERTNLLRDIARELLHSGTLPADRIVLREPRIRLLTEGYFLLNKAYKDWRIPAGQSNEKIRIAALQAMTIARFQPFIPLDPANAKDLVEVRCNEIFALVYALGILGRRFPLDASDKADFWLRVLDIMAESTIETLDPFAADINRKAQRPLEDYVLALHRRDKLVINSLISIFEVVSSFPDPSFSPFSWNVS